MAGIDRGDLYSGFKKGKSPSVRLQPTQDERPVVMGLDPKFFDRRKAPSAGKQLLKGLDTVGGFLLGGKPSQLATGLYNYRHPVRLYQHAQKYSGTSGGVLPFTPAGSVVKGSLMRPLGRNNDVASRLAVLDEAIGKHENHIAENGQHYAPKNLQTQIAHLNSLKKLRNGIAKVDIQAIMKKQPHQMTRAEFFAHPYTVFHKTETAAGLGHVSSGIHAGTLRAAYDRASPELGRGFKPGHRVSGMFITPRARKAVGESTNYSPTHALAPGKPIKLLGDHEANSLGSNFDTAFTRYFQGVEGTKPRPHYRKAPGEVKAFFNALRDPNQHGELNPFDHPELKHDVNPYFNDAEDPGSVSYVAHDPNGLTSHEAFIMKAALAGEQIPKAVLRDYPSLASAIEKARRGGGITPHGLTAKPFKRPSKIMEQRYAQQVGKLPINRTQEFLKFSDMIDQAFEKSQFRKTQFDKADALRGEPVTLPGGGKAMKKVAIDESSVKPKLDLSTNEGQHADDLHFFQNITKNHNAAQQVNSAETYFVHPHTKGQASMPLTDIVKNWGGFSPGEWQNMSDSMKQYWINDYLDKKLGYYGLSGKQYPH